MSIEIGVFFFAGLEKKMVTQFGSRYLFYDWSRLRCACKRLNVNKSGLP